MTNTNHSTVIPVAKIHGKPVQMARALTVLNLDSKFSHKLLCDGPTFSLGYSCTASCTYCYVPSMLHKNAAVRQACENSGCGFQDTLILRANALETLNQQLSKVCRGRNKLHEKPMVVFTSPLVDPAPNIAMMRDTAAAIRMILERTSWSVRVLSKFTLLPKLAEELGAEAVDRVIYGSSIGTLDDGIARAIERGAALPSKRIQAVHKLQDMGCRTFGMACPILPQDDIYEYAVEMLTAIRAEKMEHIWAEVLNTRGASTVNTINALGEAGYTNLQYLVSKCRDRDVWDLYARETFLAFADTLKGTGKLRYLQYQSTNTEAWWRKQEELGAILLS